MVNLVLIDGYEDLTDVEVDSLWEQGVCMDDWDYLLLCDDVSLFRLEGGEYAPLEYNLERMLTGCCENRWHRAEIKGKVQMVGVAYHA